MPRMSFGDRLQAALNHASTSQKALADALGISVQAVGQVLKGQTRAFTAANCAEAAVFLDVNWFWLATGKGEMARKATDDMALSPQERDLILALRVLPENERQAVILSLMEKAKTHLDQLNALLDRNKAPGSVIPLRR